MTDYTQYKRDKEISNNDVIRAVKAGFPGYSKIQNSFIMNGDKYGICLLPEAEELLIRAYGVGPGLMAMQSDCSADVQPAQKKKSARKKQNRLYVRLNDELYNRVRDLMYKLSFETVQDFLEATIITMIEQSMADSFQEHAT